MILGREESRWSMLSSKIRLWTTGVKSTREFGMTVKYILQSFPNQGQENQHNYFSNPFHWMKAVSGTLLDFILKSSAKSLF